MTTDRATRRAAGLCTSCGKHPPSAGYLQCPGCIAYGRALNASFRARNPGYRLRAHRKELARRRAANLCTGCGGARDLERFKTCSGCRLAVRHYRQFRQARRQEAA